MNSEIQQTLSKFKNLHPSEVVSLKDKYNSFINKNSSFNNVKVFKNFIELCIRDTGSEYVYIPRHLSITNRVVRIRLFALNENYNHPSNCRGSGNE